MIETQRLILRCFKNEDAEDVLRYTNAQTVHCFHNMHLKDLASAKAEIEKRKDDEYYFVICLKENGIVIGEIFSCPEYDKHTKSEADTFSPCWLLHPDYHGKGYGYEAAKAYFDFLFFCKNARRIYTYTEDYNVSCQRLCEKLGMRKEGFFKEFVTFVNNDDGTPLYENTLQYAILKNEWNK